MKFVEWFPYYQAIRTQFGYSTQQDQEAANILSNLIKRKSLDIKILRKKIQGKQVIVIGAGKGLDDNIRFLKKSRKSVKVVADGAVQSLIERRIKPDVVVSDLDGNPLFLRKAQGIGAILVVHAHGDNVGMLKKLVPKFKPVIGTTQMMPLKNVYNFGGFTDGDRCVFMAEELGAREIILIGMDFGNEIRRYSKELKNPKLKREKMKAGKRLLEILAKRSRSKLFDTARRPIKGFAYFMINSDTKR